MFHCSNHATCARMRWKIKRWRWKRWMGCINFYVALIFTMVFFERSETKESGARRDTCINHS